MFDFLSFMIKDSFHAKLQWEHCRQNGYQRWLYDIAMLSVQKYSSSNFTICFFFVFFFQWNLDVTILQCRIVNVVYYK